MAVLFGPVCFFFHLLVGAICCSAVELYGFDLGGGGGVWGDFVLLGWRFWVLRGGSHAIIVVFALPFLADALGRGGGGARGR